LSEELIKLCSQLSQLSCQVGDFLTGLLVGCFLWGFVLITFVGKLGEFIFEFIVEFCSLRKFSGMLLQFFIIEFVCCCLLCLMVLNALS
jgi:hypothetical protein